MWPTIIAGAALALALYALLAAGHALNTARYLFLTAHREDKTELEARLKAIEDRLDELGGVAFRALMTADDRYIRLGHQFVELSKQVRDLTDA